MERVRFFKVWVGVVPHLDENLAKVAKQLHLYFTWPQCSPLVFFLIVQLSPLLFRPNIRATSLTLSWLHYCNNVLNNQKWLSCLSVHILLATQCKLCAFPIEQKDGSLVKWCWLCMFWAFKMHKWHTHTHSYCQSFAEEDTHPLPPFNAAPHTLTHTWSITHYPAHSLFHT